MGERKVFNKYIPPDFDPRLLPKGQRPPNNQIQVRSMLPMTICCTQCGEYMGRGTKFNARQEDAIGMEWKGLKRWRFYLKCSSCSQEMTFLTDPENDHYVPEHGCTRNFEPWRVKQEIEKFNQAKDDEIAENAFESLQKRAAEQKSQLDINDSIDDLRQLNSKSHFMDPALIIKRTRKRAYKEIQKACKVSDEKELQIFRETQRKKFKIDSLTTVNNKSVDDGNEDKHEIQMNENENGGRIEINENLRNVINKLPFNSDVDIIQQSNNQTFFFGSRMEINQKSEQMKGKNSSSKVDLSATVVIKKKSKKLNKKKRKKKRKKKIKGDQINVDS